MQSMIRLAVASILIVALSGCATIFKGGTQEVPVSSTPRGAEIFINGVSYGTTPTSLQLEVNRSYTIVLRLDGEERTFMIRNEIGALWIILDIIGGLVPLIVDAATGDWYELQPSCLLAGCQPSMIGRAYSESLSASF
jgi:hypothetical protein